MTLNRIDKEFRHEGVSYLDYKQVEMDRVLTAFLPRLWWDGQPSRIARSGELSIKDFVELIEGNPEAFAGFGDSVTRQWVETHLLDIVSRGKPSQAVAGLRPLHGFTYRLRNARRSRPYGADEQLYEMLSHTSNDAGRIALNMLKDFFFAGVDARTEAPRLGDDIDGSLGQRPRAGRIEINHRPAGGRRRNTGYGTSGPLMVSHNTRFSTRESAASATRKSSVLDTRATLPVSGLCSARSMLATCAVYGVVSGTVRQMPRSGRP